MVDANFEYADSRWQDIYLHLKKSGFDVYSPGIKTGDCTKEYIVVKNDGSSKLPNFSTDDDLYAVLLQICKNEYNVDSPAMLRPEAKISLMRKLKNEYNASDKQLMRMLKVDNALCQKVLR